MCGMLQAGDSARLQPEALDELAVQPRMRRQYLDGDVAIHVALEAFVDGRHAALPQKLGDLVLAEFLSHQ